MLSLSSVGWFFLVEPIELTFARLTSKDLGKKRVWTSPSFLKDISPLI